MSDSGDNRSFPSRVTTLSYAMSAASTVGKAAHLAQRCSFTLIRPRHWPWYAEESAGEIPGVTVIRLKAFLAGRHHFHIYRGLDRAIRAARPELFYFDQEPWSLSTVQAVSSAARLGCAIVGFTWQNLFKRYPPPFEALERWVHRHTVMIIAGNEDAAAILRRRGYEGLIRVIPQFGVDTELFRPRPSTRAELGLPPDGVMLGYVGRLVIEKGVETVVRAVARIADVHLAVCGVGPRERYLRSLAASLGARHRVHFLGGFPSRQIPRVLNALDLLILPSLTTTRWKEQFGRVIIEAMASGVPVIGSTSGEIPRVVGDAGLLFREHDVDACERAIRAVLSPERRKELAARGAARVQQCYTQERIAERFWEAWCEAFGAWQAGPPASAKK